MKRGLCAYCLVVALIWTGCSKSVATPTPVSTAATLPAQPTSLRVTGQSALTAIGETSQLKAVATFSDGAVKDVSAETRWVSSLPSVMVVSSTGLLSVVRLGTSIIYAHYQTQSGNLSVTATPPGTVAMTGYVKEPGAGGVADGRVMDTASAMSTQTESDGRFFFALLSAGPVHLRFEKNGYEPAELDATPGAAVEIRVQQVIRLVAGETVTAPRLAPSDLTYVVGAGQRCNSCRLIRIEVPVQGTLHLRVTWPAPFAGITLGLWVGGRHVVPSSVSAQIDADVSATAGETIVYVDRVSPLATVDHVPFVVATSLTD